MSHSEAPAPKTPEEFRAYLTNQAQQLLLPFGVTEEEIAPAVLDLMKDLQPQVGRVAANLYLRKESDAFDLVFNVDAKNGKDGVFRCSNQYNTGAWAALEVMRGAAELLSIAGKNIDTLNKRISELEEELRQARVAAPTPAMTAEKVTNTIRELGLLKEGPSGCPGCAGELAGLVDVICPTCRASVIEALALQGAGAEHELLRIAGENIDTANARIAELEEELRLLRQQALVEEIRAGNWVFQLAELNGGMKEMMLRLFSGVARGWDDPGSKERRALRDLGVVVDHV